MVRDLVERRAGIGSVGETETGSGAVWISVVMLGWALSEVGVGAGGRSTKGVGSSRLGVDGMLTS